MRGLDRAVPEAAHVYGTFSVGEDLTIWRESMWEARRQQFVALSRALQPKVIPRSIKTEDLLSPFDGKQLRYSYDGKQIVIGVSRPDEDPRWIQMKIPPDAAIHS